MGCGCEKPANGSGLAQAQLAALIDVPVRAVQDWEDGREALNLWQIIGLAEALDVAPAALLEMPGKPPPAPRNLNGGADPCYNAPT